MDPERARIEEVLLLFLRSLTKGAEISVRVEGARKAWKLQWPPAGDLFAHAALPLAVPIPEAPMRGEEWPGPPFARDDFSKVTWPGVGTFLVNARQAAVVRLLYEAFVDGLPEVREDVLMREAKKAGSDAVKLREVFRHADAWGKLIVPGSQGGTYRLAPLPEE